MWQSQNPIQYKALQRMGVTAARIQVDRHGETLASAAQKATPIVQAGLTPYIENIATDFYSAYHRWTLGKPPNWRFAQLQTKFLHNPNDPAFFVRQPSLTDKNSLSTIESRLTKTVNSYARYHPIFFNLGDEPGIADLSAAWDFGFSQSSLNAMRKWLRMQYGTLNALNSEWGTNFRRWHDVTPTKTTDAMSNPDENYSAWSDFKNWMDTAFARAIKDGTKAIHKGAPWACSAIEGAQKPGWGGYNYTYLAHSVDVMEMYDSGSNLSIAQSLNPKLITLTTVNWGNPNASHYAWQTFLRGVRGIIIWDPKHQFIDSNGAPGPTEQYARPFINAMHHGLGPLLIKSRPIPSHIAVLYSPASFRIQWILDHKNTGNAWAMRGSEKENEDNAVRASRRRVLRLLMRFGITPDFVTSSQLSTDNLQKSGYKVLFLPQTLALSHDSASAIKRFSDQGGVVIADGSLGLFDEHGRRLAHPLSSHFLRPKPPNTFYLPSSNGKAMTFLNRILTKTDIAMPARVEHKDHKTAFVEQYNYRLGTIVVIALLAKPSAEKGEKTLVRLSIPSGPFIYDLHSREFLEKSKDISILVRSDYPTLLALTHAPLPLKSCKSLFSISSCAMHSIRLDPEAYALIH